MPHSGPYMEIGRTVEARFARLATQGRLREGMSFFLDDAVEAIGVVALATILQSET